MKKKLLALAALSLSAAAAQAQTNVTVYGSIDGGLRYASNQNANGNSKVTEGSTGTYQSNRLGFKGIEDLGDGMNAHFNLEQGFNSGTGAQADPTRLFNRMAFVGVGGAWGSLDLGHQYTIAFKTIGAYEPFNYKYSNIIPAGGISSSAGLRYDNDIQYAGIFGPFTARAEYALGEVAGGGNKGSAAAVGGTYASGPLSIGGAYTKRKPNILANGFGAAAGTANSGYQDNDAWTVGASYAFAPGRLAAGYSHETQDRANNGSTQQFNAWFGGSYDVTPALALTAAYYHTKVDNLVFSAAAGAGSTGTRQLFMVGGTYALSKRTNFYADIDYARFKDGLANVPGAGNGGLGGASQLPLASPKGSQLGVSFGINYLL